MTAPVTPSWSQRARLLQLVEDANAGSYRAFHSVSALRVRGPLDLAALGRAWHRLQRRHPVLLTSFHLDKPLWRLDPAEPADLTLLPAADGDQARQALVRAAEEPFDVERGPLARLVAIPLPGGPAETLVGLVADHLVCDAWSRRILARDLAGLYDLEVGARSEDLPPAQHTFPGFVADQNDYVESEAGLRLRREVAARVTPPAGGPAPAARTEPVARRLDPETYGRLLPLARSARLTRPQVVLAALDAALADLGGHFPRATTMVVAGRPRAHVQGAVGWFASQVAVVDPARHAASATAPARHAGPATARARRADPRERLSAFRAVVTAALDAARIPWPLAVADAVPALFSRPLSLPYLSFNAQPLRMRTALAPLPFAGTEVSEVPINLGRQEGALLSYWVEEDDGGLRASLRYKPGVYDEADVAALWTATAGHLAAFLRSAGR